MVMMMMRFKIKRVARVVVQQRFLGIFLGAAAVLPSDSDGLCGAILYLPRDRGQKFGEFQVTTALFFCLPFARGRMTRVCELLLVREIYACFTNGFPDFP